MKSIIKAALLWALLSTSAAAQNITHQIDSIVKASYEQNPEIGISLGFIHDNQEFYTAYGRLAKNSQIEINKNSVFEITSITKILTTNLIAQAQLEDKLKLDDYIDNYLPAVYKLQSTIRQKIKLSDLASHRSGLPDLDFEKLMQLNPQQPVSSVNQDTLVALVNNCSELLDHGHYRYSTLGYTLLGQILENVYDKTFDEIIKEKIINPLQLTNTLTTEFNIKNRTTGHSTDGADREFLEWNITAAAGLVKSSASDMITYLKAILKEDQSIYKAAQITEQTVYKVENRDMGLGISSIKDGENTIYLKSGDSMGQSSILCYNREKNWGIIILLDHRNIKKREHLLNEIYEKVLR